MANLTIFVDTVEERLAAVGAEALHDTSRLIEYSFLICSHLLCVHASTNATTTDMRTCAISYASHS